VVAFASGRGKVERAAENSASKSSVLGAGRAPTRCARRDASHAPAAAAIPSASCHADGSHARPMHAPITSEAATRSIGRLTRPAGCSSSFVDSIGAPDARRACGVTARFEIPRRRTACAPHEACKCPRDT
jgi:hypothetical protein